MFVCLYILYRHLTCVRVYVSSCARAEGVFADEVHALEEGQTASHDVLIALSCCRPGAGYWNDQSMPCGSRTILPRACGGTDIEVEWRRSLDFFSSQTLSIRSHPYWPRAHHELFYVTTCRRIADDRMLFLLSVHTKYTSTIARFTHIKRVQRGDHAWEERQERTRPVHTHHHKS